VEIALVPGCNPGPYTGDGNNTFLITGAVPTLVDAATGAPGHLAALEGALGGAALAQILVTHAHPDHADGCGALRRRFPRAVFRKLPWPERDRLQPVEFVELADGERVAAGDGHLLAIHTPGHAPDHLCFLDESSRTLFAGDLVIQGASVVIPVSRGGSLSRYLASLERIRALAPVRLLPAHGPEADEPDALLREHLEHRHRRERQIVDALAAGLREPDDVVDRLYGGIDARLRALARENVLAHLGKLGEEGRARAVGSGWELTS